MDKHLEEQLSEYKSFSGNDLRTILMISVKERTASEIIHMTGCDKSNVSKCLKKLCMTGIVYKTKGDDAVTRYMINKKWEVPQNQETFCRG